MSTQEKCTLRRLDKLLSSYVTKNPQPRWLDVDGRLDVGDHIMAEDAMLSPKLAFIECMRDEWRSERLELPTTWAPTGPKIARFVNDSTNVYNICLVTAPIRHIVDTITPSALAERYLQDGFSPSPDFCLQTYRTKPHFKPDNIQGFHEIQKTYDIEDELISPCEAAVAPLMTYTGGEHLASYVVPGIFSGIPGCWLTLQPKYHLPTSLGIPQVQHNLDFAVLPYPHSSSSVRNKIRDAALGITFTHPAICIAMKGPRGWDSSGDNPTTITPIVRALAAHTKPNLDILLATWRIHHHHSSQCPPLPDYAIIFGVIYDARHLHIVAHFLTDNLDYVSLVVDTFDFPSVVDEDNVDFAAWSESRTRMVVALLTVQKHVHRLASLWDDVHFPQDIIQVSSELDDHIMGPTYMVRTSPSVYSQTSNDSRWCIQFAPDDDVEELKPGFRLPPDSELAKSIKKWLAAVCVDEPAGMPEPELQPDSHFGLLAMAPAGNLPVTAWRVFTRARPVFRGPTPRARAHEIRWAIAGPYIALSIPEQLLLSEPDHDISWDDLKNLRSALEMYLKGVMDFALEAECVEHSKTSGIVSLPRVYPDLDVNLSLEPKPQAFRILLTHMAPISYERDVFNVMLETLPAFFDMPGCQVSHTFTPHPGGMAPLPVAIQSRMKISGIPDSRSPTLLVALPWDARPLDEGQLVLTSYFEWTLNLLVANLPSPAANHELPSWCVLYGLLYTACGVRVFAHYPEWNPSEARWQLVTETSTTGHHEEALSLPHYEDAVRIATTLMSLRRHTWEVKANLEAWLEQNGTNVLM